MTILFVRETKKLKVKLKRYQKMIIFHIIWKDHMKDDLFLKASFLNCLIMALIYFLTFLNILFENKNKENLNMIYTRIC